MSTVNIAANPDPKLHFWQKDNKASFYTYYELCLLVIHRLSITSEWDYGIILL